MLQMRPDLNNQNLSNPIDSTFGLSDTTKGIPEYKQQVSMTKLELLFVQNTDHSQQNMQIYNDQEERPYSKMS